MARVPIRQQMLSRTTGQVLPTMGSVPSSLAILASGAAQVGASIQDVRQDAMEREAKSWFSEAVSGTALYQTNRSLELRASVEGDAEQHVDTVINDFDAHVDEIASNAPNDFASEMYKEWATDYKTRAAQKEIRFAAEYRVNRQNQRYEDSLGNWSNAASKDPYVLPVAIATMDAVTDAMPGRNQLERDQLRQATRDTLIVAAASQVAPEYARAVAPQTVKAASGRSTRRPALGGVLPSLVPLYEAKQAEYGVDANVLLAQGMAESSGDPKARGSKSERGIAQFTPQTAKDYGLDDPTDPESSVDAQFRLMKDLLDRYDWDYEKALAGYNAGPGNVDKAIKRGGDNWKDYLPRKDITVPYIDKILKMSGFTGEPTPAMTTAPMQEDFSQYLDMLSPKARQNLEKTWSTNLKAQQKAYADEIKTRFEAQEVELQNGYLPEDPVSADQAVAAGISLKRINKFQVDTQIAGAVRLLPDASVMQLDQLSASTEEGLAADRLRAKAREELKNREQRPIELRMQRMEDLGTEVELLTSVQKIMDSGDSTDFYKIIRKRVGSADRMEVDGGYSPKPFTSAEARRISDVFSQMENVDQKLTFLTGFMGTMSKMPNGVAQEAVKQVFSGDENYSAVGMYMYESMRASPRAGDQIAMNYARMALRGFEHMAEKSRGQASGYDLLSVGDINERFIEYIGTAYNVMDDEDRRLAAKFYQNAYIGGVVSGLIPPGDESEKYLSKNFKPFGILLEREGYDLLVPNGHDPDDYEESLYTQYSQMAEEAGNTVKSNDEISFVPIGGGRYKVLHAFQFERGKGQDIIVSGVPD